MDSAWDEVKKYLSNTKRKNSEPELFYDNYDEESLTRIIDTQKNYAASQKRENYEEIVSNIDCH